MKEFYVDFANIFALIAHHIKHDAKINIQMYILVQHLLFYYGV